MVYIIVSARDRIISSVDIDPVGAVEVLEEVEIVASVDMEAGSLVEIVELEVGTEIVAVVDSHTSNSGGC